MSVSFSSAARVLFCVFCVALSHTTVAFADKRVALVIGNAAYAGVTKLRNPVNDATDVATKLRALGFDVLLGTDQSVAKTDDLRAEFSRKLADADVALFYFAGHGLQHKDRNYMLPVDARLANEYAIKREATSIDEIMAEMQARAKTSLIFLDACRNNPLSEKMSGSTLARGNKTDGGEGRGLARMDPGPNANTLIVFATAPGVVAEDGVGRNSPFTEAFLRHIDKPVDIEVMLKHVGRDVSAATNSRQQPERFSRLKIDFQFIASSTGEKPMVARPPSTITRDQISHWELIKNTTDPEVLKRFVDTYPGGDMANLARQKLSEWQQGKKPGQAKTVANEPDPDMECTKALAGSSEDQERFVSRYPTHACADQARRLIRMSADAVLWDRIAKSSSIAEFKKYLLAFPDGVYGTQAKDKIAMLESIDKGRNNPPTQPRGTDPSTSISAGQQGLTIVVPPQSNSFAAVAPSIQFTRYRNRWVNGDGFNNEFGGTIESCEDLCRSTDSCQMFEFYFGKESRTTKCSLFKHKGIEREATKDAHVGIRR